MKYTEEMILHSDSGYCMPVSYTHLDVYKRQVVGFEERGRARMDGSGSYKGKAEGSNSSEGLWIASPAKTPLAEAKRIYWFESAYDAMAYYQLNQKWDKELRKGVFVSTGGAPSQQQFKAMIEALSLIHI